MCTVAGDGWQVAGGRVNAARSRVPDGRRTARARARPGLAGGSWRMAIHRHPHACQRSGRHGRGRPHVFRQVDRGKKCTETGALLGGAWACDDGGGARLRALRGSRRSRDATAPCSSGARPSLRPAGARRLMDPGAASISCTRGGGYLKARRVATAGAGVFGRMQVLHRGPANSLQASSGAVQTTGCLSQVAWPMRDAKC